MTKEIVILRVSTIVTFSPKCWQNFVFYDHFQVAIWALRLSVVMLTVVAPGSSSYEKLLKTVFVFSTFLGRKF
jgi:hypothetical protein